MTDMIKNSFYSKKIKRSFNHVIRRFNLMGDLSELNDSSIENYEQKENARK